MDCSGLKLWLPCKAAITSSTQAISENLRSWLPCSSGNIDRHQDWAQHLPKVEIVKLKGITLLVTHERKDVPEPLPEGVQVVVTGHSHKPCIHEEDGVLYINPGSAGPRRFKLPISMGCVTCTAGKISGQLIDLVSDTPVVP